MDNCIKKNPGKKYPNVIFSQVSYSISVKMSLRTLGKRLFAKKIKATVQSGNYKYYLTIFASLLKPIAIHVSGLMAAVMLKLMRSVPGLYDHITIWQLVVDTQLPQEPKQVSTVSLLVSEMNEE